jgi:hypothetical protein
MADRTPVSIIKMLRPGTTVPGSLRMSAPHLILSDSCRSDIVPTRIAQGHDVSLPGFIGLSV